MRPTMVFAFLAALTVLVGVTDFHRDLTSRYRFVDDAQAHIFWTYRFQDPELFVGDIYADFYSSIMAPAGFRALYFLAAQAMDPLLFSKLLPFALLATIVVYAWRLGHALEPRWGGVVAAVLILEYSGNCRGGLPRSFFLTLLVPHVYYLATRQFGRASALLALQGLFQPIVFCLGFCLQAVALLRDVARRPAASLAATLGERRTHLGLFLGASLLAGLVVASTHLLQKPGFIGPAFSPAEAVHVADFYPGGREPFFDPDPVQFFLRSDSSGIGWNSRLARFLIAVGALLALLGRRFFRVPPIIFDMAGVSLLLFAVSHLVFPMLYFPNRYVRYTLPLAAILLIACHARAGADRVARWLPGGPWPRSVPVGWRGALAGVLLLIVSAGAVRTVVGSSTRPDTAAVGLYEFLATLPKAAVIGGTVHELNAVPLVARRKIFWHAEFHAPFFRDYYREVQRRREALRALEARAFSDIDGFCRDFGVTHFVFDRAHGQPAAVAARRPLFENARFLVTRCGPGGQLS